MLTVAMLTKILQTFQGGRYNAEGVHFMEIALCMT